MPKPSDALRRVAELLQAPADDELERRAACFQRTHRSRADAACETGTIAFERCDAALIVGSRIGETDWWGKLPYRRAPGEQKTVQIDLEEMITNSRSIWRSSPTPGAPSKMLADELDRRTAGADNAGRLNVESAHRLLRQGDAGRRSGWDKALSDMRDVGI